MRFSQFVLLIWAVLGQPFLLFGQLKPETIRFGQVPDELRERKNYLDDPSAHYFYDSKVARIRFIETGGSLEAEIYIHERIKVLTEQGKIAAKVGIPFYADREFERITSLEGITVKPSGEFFIVDTMNVRTIAVNDNVKYIEMTMPNVQPGDVIDYHYTIRRKSIEELPDFEFMNEEPTRLARVTLINNRFIRYNAVPVHIPIEPKYQRSEVDSTVGFRLFTMPRPEKIVTETWELHHIPALRKEPFMTALSDYRWRMKFIWSEFGYPRQPLEHSWKLVVAEMRKRSNYEKILEEHPEFAKLGKEVAASYASDEEKMRAIFSYVNSKVVFNQKSALFSKDQIHKVLEGTPSTQSDINLVLVGMLRGAGISSWPVLTSRKETGNVVMQAPSLGQFNSLVVAATIQGKKVFMDASYEQSFPDLLDPESFTPKGLLLLGGLESEWVSIEPKGNRYQLEVTMKGKLATTGVLTAAYHIKTDGFLARDLRLESDKSTNLTQLFKDRFLPYYPQSDIQTISIAEQADSPGILEINAQVQITDFAQTFEKGLAFYPMVAGALSEQPFQASRRVLPITLQAPEHIVLTVQLELPRGFKAKLPSGIIRDGISGASLEFFAEVKPGMLSYTFEVLLDKKEYPVAAYEALQRLYKQWLEVSQTRFFIESSS